ncbi:Peptidyl-prolyl cis-trans isomerase [Thelohanellus kitauei]|uniref:peptidylprolyl isomerase n=1 Tax=Thelohanellus kitauei TaxID=669202 RepID=A0A0C2M9A1_THEKT|nr:Peptidyl-prolyl cis-trans isomerase [Thelohanellus kitauei]
MEMESDSNSVKNDKTLTKVDFKPRKCDTDKSDSDKVKSDAFQLEIDSTQMKMDSCPSNRNSMSVIQFSPKQFSDVETSDGSSTNHTINDIYDNMIHTKVLHGSPIYSDDLSISASPKSNNSGRMSTPSSFQSPAGENISIEIPRLKNIERENLPLLVDVTKSAVQREYQYPRICDMTNRGSVELNDSSWKSVSPGYCENYRDTGTATLIRNPDTDTAVSFTRKSLNPSVGNKDKKDGPLNSDQLLERLRETGESTSIRSDSLDDSINSVAHNMLKPEYSSPLNGSEPSISEGFNRFVDIEKEKSDICDAKFIQTSTFSTALPNTPVNDPGPDSGGMMNNLSFKESTQDLDEQVTHLSGKSPSPIRHTNSNGSGAQFFSYDNHNQFKNDGSFTHDNCQIEKMDSEILNQSLIGSNLGTNKSDLPVNERSPSPLSDDELNERGKHNTNPVLQTEMIDKVSKFYEYLENESVRDGQNPEDAISAISVQAIPLQISADNALRFGTFEGNQGKVSSPSVLETPNPVIKGSEAIVYQTTSDCTTMHAPDMLQKVDVFIQPDEKSLNMDESFNSVDSPGVDETKAVLDSVASDIPGVPVSSSSPIEVTDGKNDSNHPVEEVDVPDMDLPKVFSDNIKDISSEPVQKQEVGFGTTTESFQYSNPVINDGDSDLPDMNNYPETTPAVKTDEMGVDTSNGTLVKGNDKDIACSLANDASEDVEVISISDSSTGELLDDAVQFVCEIKSESVKNTSKLRTRRKFKRSNKRDFDAQNSTDSYASTQGTMRGSKKPTAIKAMDSLKRKRVDTPNLLFDRQVKRSNCPSDDGDSVNTKNPSDDQFGGALNCKFDLSESSNVSSTLASIENPSALETSEIPSSIDTISSEKSLASQLKMNMSSSDALIGTKRFQDGVPLSVKKVQYPDQSEIQAEKVRPVSLRKGGHSRSASVVCDQNVGKSQQVGKVKSEASKSFDLPCSKDSSCLISASASVSDILQKAQYSSDIVKKASGQNTASSQENNFNDEQRPLSSTPSVNNDGKYIPTYYKSEKLEDNRVLNQLSSNTISSDRLKSEISDELSVRTSHTSSNEYWKPLSNEESTEVPIEEEEKTISSTKDFDEFVDMFENGKLLKRVITKGDVNLKPPEYGQLAKVDLLCYTSEGDLVDHYTGDVVVGEFDIPYGVDFCLQTMRPGSEAYLKVDSRYAYRDYEWKIKDVIIPPKSDLEYHIKLIDVRDFPSCDYFQHKDIIRICEYKKFIGNNYAKAGDYGTAAKCYRHFLSHIQGVSGVDDMITAVTNNLAMCYIKEKQYSDAKVLLDDVLRQDGQNTKALMRMSHCLEALGDLREALIYAGKAHELCPDEHTERVLKSIKQKLLKHQVELSKFSRRMFNNETTQSADVPKRKTSVYGIFTWKGALVLSVIIGAGVMLFAKFRGR